MALFMLKMAGAGKDRVSSPLVVIPAKEDVKESDFSDFVEPD
jgi:hypothetical protein